MGLLRVLGRTLLVVCFVIFMGSCNTSSEQEDENTSKYYKVNLFPDEQKEVITSTELSLQEAIDRSERVVVSNSIRLVDVSSKERSVKEFYLYKVYNAKPIKNKTVTVKGKLKQDTLSSFYFYSDKKLSIDSVKNDSLYIFLETNHNKKIISQRYQVHYNWLLQAPIIFKTKK